MPFAHTPYDGSARPFTIGLKRLDLADWIEPDDRLEADLAEKDALLCGARGAVFAEEAGSRPAQGEVLALLAAHLVQQFPALYRAEGDRMRIGAGGRLIALDSDAPLLVAGRLVQEDLVLLQRGETGWRMVAASLSFPSSWLLAEKIGRDMAAIHAGVPGYAGQMGERVARIFDHLAVDQPVWRLNWSLQGNARLHHPPETGRGARFPSGDDLGLAAHLRVERQTLRRLPVSGAILFTIRVYLDPLAALRRHAEGAALATGLRQQLRDLTGEQLAYKGLSDHREAIDALLAEIAEPRQPD